MNNGLAYGISYNNGAGSGLEGVQSSGVAVTAKMEEHEVVVILDRIANRFASKFKFGYHDADDMKQQARLFALEALPRYSKDKGPLENFLSVHVRNRLINFKRDNYHRFQAPCIQCPFYDPNNLKSTNQCAEFIDKMECDKWRQWILRNDSKRSIMAPATSENTDYLFVHEASAKTSVSDIVANKELLEYIDENLPVELRSDYLRLKENLAVSKHRKNKVREAVLKIIEEADGGQNEESD